MLSGQDFEAFIRLQHRCVPPSILLAEPDVFQDFIVPDYVCDSLVRTVTRY
jgi:hypothetical protein